MKYFIIRNMTIEPFFQNVDAAFSGYEDISVIDEQADRYIWFYLAPIAENHIIAEKIQYYADLIRMTLKRIPTGKMIIVYTMKCIFSVQSISSEKTVINAINKYNDFLYDLASKYGNIKIVDFALFLDKYKMEELIDWKYYFLAQMAINPRLAGAFQEWFSVQIQAIELKRKKCLVLDLDNTLWGGILGEDGIAGVALGGEYPGKAFLVFQQLILALNHQGILLAICSKNNIDDVRQLWNEHPDSILKEEHFSALRINWNNKADNIREMVQELNIGLDSLVFLDDNPAEREMVQNYLPEVVVPEFPDQPYMLPAFFKEIAERYFSIYILTDEDKVKTEQYKENTERNKLKEQFIDMDAYIKKLEIKITVEKMNKLNIVRFAQMTQKTNQFNLTTKRYTEFDIQAFSDNGNWVYGLRVKDRFGDNGITGLIMIELNDQNTYIDTLLLSCRILGKDIEYAFTNYLLNKLKTFGFEHVKATYIRTTKNNQVEEFYEKIGFEPNKILQDRKEYILNLKKIDFVVSDLYQVEEA
jgi:FkbH-like protein